MACRLTRRKHKLSYCRPSLCEVFNEIHDLGTKPVYPLLGSEDDLTFSVSRRYGFKYLHFHFSSQQCTHHTLVRIHHSFTQPFARPIYAKHTLWPFEVKRVV